MKRLLLFTLLANSILLSIAQCTPDNSITQPGVYPEQPDTAFADQAYDFSFQVLALKDTAVIFAGQNLNATIDSVKVDAVLGLPAGFDYTCNPTNCVFTWQAVGCVNVKGNPTQNQAGVYELEIATTAFARAGLFAVPVPDTADGYQLVIKGDGSAAIEETKNGKVQVYPNPSQNGYFIIADKGLISEIEVCDIQGKVIDFLYVMKNNSIHLNLSNSPRGIYHLTAYTEKGVLTQKLVY